MNPDSPLPSLPNADPKASDLAGAAASEAEALTRVRTGLPDFFNPLFRSQGGVNSALIRADRALAQGAERESARLDEFGRSVQSFCAWARGVIGSQAAALDELRAEVGRLRLLCGEQAARTQELAGTLAGLASRAVEARPGPARAPAPAPAGPAAATGTGPVDEEALYLAFQDAFRGSRVLIASRLEAYFTHFAALGLDPARGPALDLGCGRGEWLSLLKARGWSARGIDGSAAMVGQCADLGLDARLGEVPEALAGVPSGSVQLLSAFHLIEHLPFEPRLRLFREAHRVLAPGGVAIFETPNPLNILVGSAYFYTDPTHVAPLPPAPTRFFVQSAGFKAAEVLWLNPMPESERLSREAGAAGAFINERCLGAQDYAIVATKA